VAERPGPRIYSIAAHRGFADALVAGLVPRYAEEDLGLARLTLLLPSTRAIRTVSEAFIRHSGEGLLMPRMAAVGDLDLDETLGPLLDPLGSADIAPAVDPTRRWLRLAQIIGEERPELKGAVLLRLARQMASTMDRLLVEDVAPEGLLDPNVVGMHENLAGHWQRSMHLFARVQLRWLSELEGRGELDASARRNRLFDHAAQHWRESPPPTPIVAAGVTSAAPALARLLRVIAELPDGSVILPDLDLSMDQAVWDELGRAGAPAGEGEEVFAASDAVTHPQYHLKLLLNRKGVARGEVQQWHRAGPSKGPPERSHAISNLFLPPEASKAWVDLPPEKRRLSGVRIMELPNPEAEAQSIALLARQALDEPEKRVAIVTPDRSLAARIVSHLKRWNIEADDSAGRPLTQTPPARLLLLLAELMGEQAPPVPLISLLQHPLVHPDEEERPQWLENARKLELSLRGPRPEPGLDAIRAVLASKRSELLGWWDGVSTVFTPLLEAGAKDAVALSEALDLCVSAIEALCGIGFWGRPEGRALSALVEDLRLHAEEVGTSLRPVELETVLRDAMDQVAVRPSYGKHPRLAVYGLLESRMSRADLVICAALNEGSWPARPSQEPLLAPAVLRALGVPGADFRIGLSAHDLAGALGAPEVVLSRSIRDADGPAIASRFLLRVKALLGTTLIKSHLEQDAPVWAAAIGDAERLPDYPPPEPKPSAGQRKVTVSVTGLDRLRGDPYQFYAGSILGLRKLDPLDSDPTPAWMGEVAHLILEEWHRHGGTLAEVAERILEQRNSHPLVIGLWRPRLLAALEEFERIIVSEPGREPFSFEEWGRMEVDGVTIRGRADRIDRLPDGTLAIVDYKTGAPPSTKQVEKGYAMQLGTIGLMAQAGVIDGVSGEPARFEYWSLGKSKNSETGFGYWKTPVRDGRNQSTIMPEKFLPMAEKFLCEALATWINGDAPFKAAPNPDYQGYNDFDQLMRLDEWQAITDAQSEAEGDGE
jgi:ATP-dependent helicase/nuclease subunit B